MHKILGYQITERDIHYLEALVVLTGAIFFWRGVWDVGYLIPYIENPFVSIFIGLTILTMSGAIFTEFDPFSGRLQKTLALMNDVVSEKHLKSKGYSIKYYDEKKQDLISIPHHKIHKIENQYLILRKGKKEEFIPIHRVREIAEKGKVIWKKGN